MDYKKIIAATAVTSAAFVVPAVVGAEETITEKVDLIAENTYSVGDTVKLAIQEIEETKDGVTTKDKIVAYEWYIGGSTKVVSTAAEFKLPLDAAEKSIKLVVITEGKKQYKDSISVEKLSDVDILDEKGKKIESALVNSIITINSVNIENKEEVITGYEWYLVEDGQYKPLAGENELDLDIPLEYSGKKVLFVVKTESGKRYYRNVPVKKFELASEEFKFEIKVNGKPVEDGLNTKFLIGDQIEIITPEIKGINDELISDEDLTIEYKWVAVNSSSNKIALPNVTGNLFTIPVDSEKKAYQGFNVDVTVSIPTLETKTYTWNNYFNVNMDNIDILKGAIDNLQKSNYLELPNEVKKLQEQYNALNASAKSLITNYTKLTEYAQALKVVAPLTDQFNVLYSDFGSFLNTSDEVLIKHQDLLKRANTLRQAFNKLTTNQRQVFDMYLLEQIFPTVNELHEWIVKLDDDEYSYSSTKAVKDFNTKVEETVFNREDHTYQLGSEENNLTILSEMEKNVKKYLDEAKTIDKAYQALLKIDILKMAQSDIKKARSVIEKINKIEPITDKKKKAAAVIAAEKAYNKLNIAQTTLLSETTLLKLTNPSTDDTENSEVLEDEEVAFLIERIGELQSSNMTIDDLELELSEIAIEYKLLTSAQKKPVTNYKTVSAVKKDVSAAKRVANAILKAEEAKEDADSYVNDDKRSKYISKMKSAQSKYNSAYKAYAKLTTTQKALVDGASLETAVKQVKDIVDNEEFAGKQEYTSGSTSSLILKIGEIQAILAEAETASVADTLSGSDLDKELQELIKDAQTMYKGLNSFEKKLVYNYGVISTASSHLSKATSVKKRLVAATDEKKLTSVKKAFDKLQAVQKGLIVGSYLEAISGVDSDDSSTSVADDNLSSFIEVVDLTEFDREGFEELQKELKSLSSKELKSLKDYSKYQALLKDLNAVDSFVAKMLKLGKDPVYSKKESIYKSYLKLTQNQQQLLTSYENPYEDSDSTTLFELLDNWNKQATSKADELNTQIAGIIVEGAYSVILDGETSTEKLNEFEQLIADINKDYKALDSKERKLVVNYSFIKNADKDIKAVRKVLQLEADPNKSVQFVQALNKLTADQKTLYNLVK